LVNERHIPSNTPEITRPDGELFTGQRAKVSISHLYTFIIKVNQSLYSGATFTRLPFIVGKRLRDCNEHELDHVLRLD
jgi:hypothetical protein